VRLDTPSLFLLCLTTEQLRGCRDAVPALEAELGLNLDPQIVDPNVARAIGLKLEKMEQGPAVDYSWLTYWLIVEKDQQRGIGFAGFKGAPDAAGEAEIGYGLAPAHRGKGFATEAVGALCRWAFSQPSLQTITATTVTNPDSNRVLEKLGAEVVRCEGGTMNWKIRHST